VSCVRWRAWQQARRGGVVRARQRRPGVTPGHGVAADARLRGPQCRQRRARVQLPAASQCARTARVASIRGATRTGGCSDGMRALLRSHGAADAGGIAARARVHHALRLPGAQGAARHLEGEQGEAAAARDSTGPPMCGTSQRRDSRRASAGV